MLQSQKTISSSTIVVASVVNFSGEKIRYSDAELKEFKLIIEEKLAKAQYDYEQLRASNNNTEGNDTLDTSPVFKPYENVPDLSFKEDNAKMTQRQLKFIGSLERALIRIENKTYGICRKCHKLIPPMRLKAVPHATLCILDKEAGEDD